MFEKKAKRVLIRMVLAVLLVCTFVFQPVLLLGAAAATLADESFEFYPNDETSFLMGERLPNGRYIIKLTATNGVTSESGPVDIKFGTGFTSEFRSYVTFYSVNGSFSYYIILRRESGATYAQAAESDAEGEDYFPLASLISGMTFVYQPVFRIYNGVKLPDVTLNVFPNDKYFLITYNPGTTVLEYRLSASPAPFVYDNGFRSATGDLGSVWDYYYFGDDQWTGYYFWPVADNGVSYADLSGTVVWSSHDILAVDGSTYFPGADPSPPAGDHSIISVLITAPATNVQPGEDMQLAASVFGRGDYSDAVSWSLDAAVTDSGTLISADGLLTVGPDEQAVSITVRAASIQDPDVWDVSILSVSSGGGVVPDATAPSDPDGGGGTSDGDTPDSGDTPSEPGGNAPDSGNDPSEPVGDSSGDGENEREEFENEGGGLVDDITDAIPDYSEGFMDALRDFASSMIYSGTDAVLPIPAIVFPEIGGLVPSFTLLKANSLDFGQVFQIVPDTVMELVQALFTIALIVYCFKELYGTISYVLTLRGGGA